MAMEKEKLLAYFQEHYISRQEVLYKLPLNISIESFWPELLKRRKARAVVLPLNDASGMPYWYVQTERMVRASERLCEEAMAQEEDFDPYRAPMTSAMTEEMFFTSFVEGAQIPLQEAMDFLQRGTEPENIQEQMIWNNRSAWSGMMSTLYRPMDEQFVKSLAWTLTEEMDNAAQDYRQTDDHPIAAMNSETYVVPPAHCLPDRMQEFYEFLRCGSIHPLIKASVGQAFILVTRPFPEGNERLARMISAAVLLRSGYDFFRNISISSVIAKESYRYYKSMCEILRSENGGDLTYFVEYHLELLVRALEAKKERDRRREQEKNAQKIAEHQEMLDQERKLALTPLATIRPEEAEDESVDPCDPDAEPGETVSPEVIPTESPPLCSEAEYREKLLFLASSSKRGGVTQKMNVLLNFLDKGVKRFTAEDYKRETGTDGRVPYKACLYFYQKGLVTRQSVRGVYWYALAYQDDDENFEQGNIQTKQSDQELIENTGLSSETMDVGSGMARSPLLPQAMDYIVELYRSGIESFTSTMLRERIDITSKQAYDICRMLIQKDWIEIVSTERPMRYRLTESAPVSIEEESVEIPTDSKYGLLLKRLDEMSGNRSTERDKRIAGFLRKRVDEDQLVFYRDDFIEFNPHSKSVVTNDLRYAANLGLIERSAQRLEGTNGYEYRICEAPSSDVNIDGLTEGQIFYLTHIYRNFGQQEFTIGQIAEQVNANPSTAGFHMANLHERGLLRMRRRGNRPSTYQLAICPDDYPECFDDCDRDAEMQMLTSSARTVRAGYAASAPLRTAVAVGL